MRDILLLEFLVTLAAGVTGGFVLLLALALARVCGWPTSYAYIAAAGAALFSWLAWSSRAADILEHLTGAARKPPTTPKNATVDLRIHEERGEYLVGTFLDRLPVSDDGLAALAGMVLSGQSLTTSVMTAGGLSRANWELLRDRFISAGLMQWRGGNRNFGVEITGRGMRVFSRLASPMPCPPYSPTGSDALTSGAVGVENLRTHALTRSPKERW